jgi:hypothetical protein
MQIEMMIYIYGAVCISMIVFNIFYNIMLKGSQPRMKKRCQKFAEYLEKQLDRIKSGETVQQEHLNYLRHKMKRVNYLIVFDNVLKEELKQYPEAMEEYLHQI